MSLIVAVTSVRAWTFPALNYNQLSKSIVEQSSIVVRVLACHDAHIALSEIFNNILTRTYEIVIGGYENQNSFIRDYSSGGEVQKVSTPNIMDCYNYKAFWVSWAGHRLKVGEGAAIGQRMFLDWVDPEERLFQGLTVSTWGDAAGWWELSYTAGEHFVSGVFFV
jgi:hypothetical protein